MANSFLLDLLFPKKCVNCGKLGSYICRNCFARIEFIDKPLCPVCERQSIGGKTHPGCFSKLGLDGLVVVCRYRGPISKAIQKIKYKWIWDIEKLLVDIVADNFWKFDVPAKITLVPVPLHIKRKNWRGFNQVELLANDLAKRYKQPYIDLLERKYETRTQVGLSKKDREENVRGAFIVKPQYLSKVEGGDFMLVDDVCTSGATMGECCRVLKRAGARSVWGLAVALG